MTQLRNKWSLYWRLMRFDKPIGILLLLWPSLWGLWLAARGIPPAKQWIIFMIGVVVMRAAGCVVNDFADRKFDRHVGRTQDRVLTSGKVNANEALILFTLLCFIALILVLCLNRFAMLLSLVALVVVIVYPFLKRFTYLPQLALGFAFSWSIPMAFAAIQNQIPLQAWILFVAAWLWPIAYDTQYAMVDREDDKKVGIKSTALLFGYYDIWVILLIQGIFVALLISLGIYLSFNPVYFVGVVTSILLFLYQLVITKSRQPQACFRAFLNNNWVGLLIFLGFFGAFFL